MPPKPLQDAPGDGQVHPSLAPFHPAVAEWFTAELGPPTAAQERAWPAIREGSHTLVAAPTGSGKTLAAFLAALDDLTRESLERQERGEEGLPDETRVVYVSPLKALSNDIHRNLEIPLAGIEARLAARGLPAPGIRRAVRSGDTPARERSRMARRPPHLLVTTPESLYILLGSDSGRRMLSTARTVIVDEIHAVAGNKRGSHLALTLERLDALAGRPLTRIGLSATQKPVATVARFLVGTGNGTEGGQAATPAAGGGGGGAGTSGRPGTGGSPGPGDLPGAGGDPETGGIPGTRGHRGPAAPGPEAGGTPPDPAPACRIVDVGHRRALELAVEVPESPLEAVMPHEVWAEIYDRLAALVEAHRTTLVFVNTRRLAERVTRHLAERLGDGDDGAARVAAHHGSLSKEQRLESELRLKEGRLEAMVATASLELGIDVGAVDLVCQVGSTRSIATLLQRVGRSGHQLGGVSRGRLFPLTRDELVECAALLDAVRRGELDRLRVPEAPLDVLAQQIVAAATGGEWGEDELFALVRRAWPYRHLPRSSFDAVVEMLAHGFSTRHGRRAAYLHHDAVNRRLRARRGARLTALTSGGAIPDTADYRVLLEPAGTVIGSVNEDFAVESMAGDVFQLGNASWRILKIEPGQLRVEDARGEVPNIPFWFGEAPGRSDELSAAVSRLREEVERRLAPGGGDDDEDGDEDGAGTGGRDAAVAWLVDRVGLAPEAAVQLVAYLAAGHAALGLLPTHRTVVAERFFDEAGDTHLVIHSPFGSRINRAWGLALRKRFCRTFNFELQAAAGEDALVLSLGPTHSFPLETVFSFLHSATVRELLVQALLDSPLFGVRWRWNASRALALPRMRGGRRVPPQLQRHRSEDLLAVVFPDQLACLETVEGDREVPDHPLVEETVRDCLTDAMDVDALEALLAAVEAGEVATVARDLTEPSPLAHEILNANPYAFLDDAPLEERRTQAVVMRRWLDPETAADLGALDAAAIRRVRDEAHPTAADPDELHDALVTSGWLTAAEVARAVAATRAAERSEAGDAPQADGGDGGADRNGDRPEGGAGAGAAPGNAAGADAEEAPVATRHELAQGRDGSAAEGTGGGAADVSAATGPHPGAGQGRGGSGDPGAGWLATLAAAGRAARLLPEAAGTGKAGGGSGTGNGEGKGRGAPPVRWVAAERLPEVRAAFPGARLEPALEPPRRLADLPPPSPEEAVRELLRSRLQMLGPVTATDLARESGLPRPAVDAALAALETEGSVMQGRFTPRIGGDDDRSAGPGTASVPDTGTAEGTPRLAGPGTVRSPETDGREADPGRSATPDPAPPPAGAGDEPDDSEWCERRLLARIHRYTLNRLRREIEPVSRADLSRFLLAWQRVAAGEQGRGPEAVAAVLEQLAGFSAPAAAWEGEILPARVKDYDPTWLDALCLSGRFVWCRATPPDGGRAAPIRTTPITFLPREELARWRQVMGDPAGTGDGGEPRDSDGHCPDGHPSRPRFGGPAGAGASTPKAGGEAREKAGTGTPTPDSGGEAGAGAGGPSPDAGGQADPRRVGDPVPGGSPPSGAIPGPCSAALSADARQAAEVLARRGASFFADLASAAGLLPTRAEGAVAELVAHGLVTADSFTGLRALLVPADRRPPPRRPGASRPGSGRTARGGRPGVAPFSLQGAGRWSLLSEVLGSGAAAADGDGAGTVRPAGWSADPEAVETVAWTLLGRYGVVFRALLAREDLLPPWRELLWTLRRLEARGEVRGGRFVAGFAGEQFALPEAVARLRSLRRQRAAEARARSSGEAGTENGGPMTAGATGNGADPGPGGLVSVSAADPLNLAGILLPGARVAALTGNRLLYRDGELLALQEAREVRFLPAGDGLEPAQRWQAEQALVRSPAVPALRPYLR